MSVNAIRLQNFMAFQDTGWLELGDISLLFGRNSSGKSAIIRAIRLLKQSLNPQNETGHLRFDGDEGNDFGSLQTILNHLTEKDEDAGNIVRFQFRCTLTSDTRDILQPYLTVWRHPFDLSPLEIDKTPDWLELSLGFADIRGATRLIEIVISAPWIVNENNALIFYTENIVPDLILEQLAEKEQFDEWEDVQKRYDGQNSYWYIETNVLAHIAIDATVDFVFGPGFLPKIKLDEQVSTDQDLSLIKYLLDDLTTTIRTFFRSVQYLGPLRPSPERYYTLKKKKLTTALAQFLADGEQSIASDDIKEIDRWLQELKLGFKTVNEKDEKEKGKILFTDGQIVLAQLQIYESSTSDKPINIVDLGSGTNQVFPIIVQSILAHPGSLVIIEQPELHLHPAAQAELAEVFMLKANQGVRFILETHSESLFLRFRRRIAETTANIVPTEKERQKLDVTNLKAYFFHRDIDEENEKLFSSITELAITEWGEYAQSPPTGFKNFFSSDLEELAQITEARLKASKSFDKQ